jgi:kinesin family protein 2/24
VPKKRPHQQIGDSSARIIVSIRKRPILESLGESPNVDANYDCVTCLNPCTFYHGKEERLGIDTGRLSAEKKEFDHTFDAEDDNADVYSVVAEPLVSAALAGSICTVLAFGQTSSGKTHTQSYVQLEALRQMYSGVEETNQKGKEGAELYLTLSFFENAGNLCLDLLDDRHPMELRTDGDGHVHVVGLTEKRVDGDCNAAVDMIHQGALLRATKATGSNPQSSRSHGILRISVRDGADNDKMVGMFRVVDLAGSERKRHSAKHNTVRQEESRQINWSLGCLKECIRDQFIRETSNPSQHIKYRNCKLTHLLKECFTGSSHLTSFVACLAPLSVDRESTRSTLDYARQLKVVEDTKAKKEEGGGSTKTKRRKQPIQEWSRKKVARFIGLIDGGSLEKHASAFSQVNGKALCQMWSGDFAKKCNGNEKEGEMIYDVVSRKKKEAKAEAREEQATKEGRRKRVPSKVDGSGEAKE